MIVKEIFIRTFHKIIHAIVFVARIGEVVASDMSARLKREREKEMFYLIYGYMASDGEKGNPLPPHRLLLLINSKGSFICTIPKTG